MVAALFVLAGGCAAAATQVPEDASARALSGAPVALTGAVTGDPTNACATPLRVPSSRITLTLVRSQSGRGDYRPDPVDAYGMRVTELLRVDCRSGRVIGAVRA